MKKYLVIGNGVAGTTAAEYIRKNDATGEITIVSTEDLPFYYRVRLPELLGGHIPESQLVARKKEWYDENKIILKLNTEIDRLDIVGRKASTRDNKVLTYDYLLLANGSHAFVPPIKGSTLNGAFTLHTINDVRRISRFAKNVKTAVVIGGGLLGLEAANELHKLGINITVIEYFPRLLPRQLDREGAARLRQYFENMDFRFRLGAVTREINGHRKVEQLVLESDESLRAEMVLIAAGVRPDLKLARMLDLKTDKGILVDKYLQTSRQAVYAAGDVIQFNNLIYGIWTAAREQGKIAGINISGGKKVYAGTTPANILKVAGIDLASAGNIDEDNRLEAKIVETASVYKKVVIDKDRVLGCIMLGDLKNFNRIKGAIASGEDLLPELESLLTS